MFIVGLLKSDRFVSQLVEGRWDSDISRAKDRQIQEFKERVMFLNEENTLSHSLQITKTSKS